MLKSYNKNCNTYKRKYNTYKKLDTTSQKFCQKLKGKRNDESPFWDTTLFLFPFLFLILSYIFAKILIS